MTESAPTGAWPDVSVIVATRGRPQLLSRAVASILGQSYPGPLECVLVFDQNEPSDVPVEARAGRRLQVLTNTRAPGLAGARNTGIAATDGPLIAFCDDDDAWQPSKLALQVDLLERSAAGFIACGVRIHHGGHTADRLPPAEVSFGELVRDRVTALHPSTFLIRRSALTAIGLVDEEIPGSYGEDYDLLLRAARNGRILSVRQPLVDVFWHEQSYFAERWQTITDALRFLLGKHPELSADPVGRARIDGQIAFAEAALARRLAACRSSLNALRGNPRERRAYLALAVAAGVIPAKSVIRAANRRGHGI
ncbi:MAG: glycosyltransferase [Streptosporangiaceae bacterium]|nr:glycosyltransferase [Streptosporangiaceae bacterium]